MAPRKIKNNNKKINDGGECSSAATKRRRVQVLNGTTGVPGTNPTSEFPSTHLPQGHRNPPRPTTIIGAGPQHSPPEATPNPTVTDLNIAPQPQQEAAAPEDDDPCSPVITQQNMLLGFLTEQFRVGVEQIWRRTLAQEVRKRTLVEASLKQKDEMYEASLKQKDEMVEATLKQKDQMVVASLKQKDQIVAHFRKLYHFYEERTVMLEDMLQRRVAGEGTSAAAEGANQEEEVQSSFVDPNSLPMRMEMACRNCRSRPATMVWLPCRHLCICLLCEMRVRVCPICNLPKTESFMINILFP